MRYRLKTDKGVIASTLEVLANGNGRLTVTDFPPEPLQHSVEKQLAYWRQEYVDKKGWTLIEEAT